MKRIAVLTSGGDAPGMNAAVRSVVRTALDSGADTYAVNEGYRGLIEGGHQIHPIGWNDVGGILHLGGTIIGSARCDEYRTREGRHKAVRNLLNHGIDGLVVIGGDGSLTGANILQQEWPEHVQQLLADGDITAEQAERHSYLAIAGLPGSIDNDLCGTDITIGADTALHRITDAVDAITSTAASHQRSFVVEVMGRKCGYLAMMSALASAADWVLIPESPPNLDNWEDKMCSVLRKGREMGRRDSIVIVAEGAHDRYGKPISSAYVKKVLEDRLGEDTRLTILGHVQRGGRPTAFDRNLSTLLGADAVDFVLNARVGDDATFIGMKGNKVTRTPLSICLSDTAEVTAAVQAREFEAACELRGSSFKETFRILRTLVRAWPHPPVEGQRRLRIAIMNAGAPAPGMNTAVRAAVRLSVDRGHHVLGVYHGFEGLIRGDIVPFDWMTVNGWAHVGGSELGTNRKVPAGADFYQIARNIEEHDIEALLVIGGTSGYEAAMALYQQRGNFPAFNMPIICIPATIDNDLPGAELSVGADTALNSIVDAVDRIKQSAVAARRVFVVEVMGRFCGYLALMGALATGAERVYLHEEGVTLSNLVEDVEELVKGFKRGKRLGLVIRNEWANQTYTTPFMCALFEEEGKDLFDVRSTILGHLQQGGNPTPFDRILATRLAARCIEYLEEHIDDVEKASVGIGLIRSAIRFTRFDEMSRMMDDRFKRPKEQWWLNLRPIARVMAQP
ncbi:MAG: 6-phosphofructokinase, partial [Anaerolineales bacterium]|nr:6-phosphofructokinase [Anaerolineales bacterium]